MTAIPVPTTQIHDYYVRATPERVWQALTTGEVTERYFYGSFVRSSYTPGSPIVFTAGASGPVVVEGTIKAIEPGQRLVHSWIVRYDASRSDEVSEVDWRLEPHGADTRLVVTHRLHDAPKTAEHLAEGGWGWVLSSLKSLLETGAALVAPAPPPQAS